MYARTTRSSAIARVYRTHKFITHLFSPIRRAFTGSITRGTASSKRRLGGERQSLDGGHSPFAPLFDTTFAARAIVIAHRQSLAFVSIRSTPLARLSPSPRASTVDARVVASARVATTIARRARPPPSRPSRPSPALARVRASVTARAPHRRRIKPRASPASIVVPVSILARARAHPARRHRDRAETRRAKVEESRRPEQRRHLRARDRKNPPVSVT